MRPVCHMLLATLLCASCCSSLSQHSSRYTHIILALNGTVSEKKLLDDKSCLEIANQIVQSIDEPIRLIVTDRTIKDIKKGEFLEVILPETVTTEILLGNTISYDRMLISLNVENEQSSTSSIVVYLGNKRYYSPPYINKTGRPLLNKLIKIEHKELIR